MHSRTMLSMLTLVTATNAAGCYSTWDIEPRTLLKLNGFRAGQTVQLPSWDGEVDFDAESIVHLEGKDGVEADIQFNAIQIQEPVLFGLTRPDRMALNVDLQRMSKVQIRKFSTTKTGLLATGAVLGAASGTIGGLLWFYLNYSPD